MAHHQSAKKRIRQSEKRRLRNRYKKKRAKKLEKKLMASKNPTEAAELLPQVKSSVDSLVKHNIIHKNNAARKKSRLTRWVQDLQQSNG
jgi:small subunit ribosomal protein S20